MRAKLLLVSLLAATAGPTLAEPVPHGAGVQLTAVHYYLHDTDLDDGIASTATLVSRRAVATALAYGYGNRWHQLKVGHPVFGDGNKPLMTSVLRGASFAESSSFTVDELLWLQSAGTAASNAGRFEGFAGSSRFTVAYRLAPHTEMHWIGRYSMNAWATPSDIWQSRAAIQFGERSSIITATAYADPSLEESSAFKTGLVEHVLRNDTDKSKRVVATFAALAAGGSAPESYSNMSQVVAVPEPETYALMLAGAGVVGFAARRRRS